MQIFQVVAGYSLGRADIVRRAISKKKRSVLESERSAFLEGAAKRGIAEEAATALFEEIAGFADYAFNKSHAAAYAVLSYRTAYLKVHYPRQYISALMTSVLGAADKLAEYIAECTRLGIHVLPPHVNESAWNFHVDGKNIRFGLLALKNLGRQFVDVLLEERSAHGKFVSFADFVSRMGDVGLNKKQLETLIRCGALDGLGARRSQMLAVYESALDSRSQLGRQSIDGQLDLFSLAAGAAVKPEAQLQLPDIPEYSARELLRMEKDSAGLFFSGHLLDDYALHIAALKPDSVSAIKQSFLPNEEQETENDTETPTYADKQTVILAGILTRRQNKSTRGGESMAFLTLEDRGGEIELIVFPKVLAEYGLYLTVNAAVAVRGTISLRDEDEPKLLLRDMQPLMENAAWQQKHPPSPAVQSPPIAPQQVAAPQPEQPKKAPTRLFLKVESMESEACHRAECFLNIFSGTFPVVFYDASSGKYLRAEHLHAALNDFVLRELSEILGKDCVVLR